MPPGPRASASAGVRLCVRLSFHRRTPAVAGRDEQGSPVQVEAAGGRGPAHLDQRSGALERFGVKAEGVRLGAADGAQPPGPRGVVAGSGRKGELELRGRRTVRSVAGATTVNSPDSGATMTPQPGRTRPLLTGSMTDRISGRPPSWAWCSRPPCGLYESATARPAHDRPATIIMNAMPLTSLEVRTPPPRSGTRPPSRTTSPARQC